MNAFQISVQISNWAPGPEGELKGVKFVKFQNATPPSNIKGQLAVPLILSYFINNLLVYPPLIIELACEYVISSMCTCLPKLIFYMVSRSFGLTKCFGRF